MAIPSHEKVMGAIAAIIRQEISEFLDSNRSAESLLNSLIGYIDDDESPKREPDIYRFFCDLDDYCGLVGLRDDDELEEIRRLLVASADSALKSRFRVE